MTLDKSPEHLAWLLTLTKFTKDDHDLLWIAIYFW